MVRTRLFLKVMALLTVGGTMLQGTCLPDNFWVGKWGEIVNGAIITGVNVVLGLTTGGLPGGPYAI